MPGRGGGAPGAGPFHPLRRPRPPSGGAPRAPPLHPARAAPRYAPRTSHPGPHRAFTAATTLAFADPGAWATLPAWARAEEPASGPGVLCHGDLHLGQLVRHPDPDGTWLLIDVDDLGTGTPAWDLARPAAWYACGLLSPEEWNRFLTAYRAAGGPAVPPGGDPWAALDPAARALTVQSAARAVTKAAAARRPLDEVEQAVVDACDRMGRLPAPPSRTRDT